MQTNRLPLNHCSTGLFAIVAVLWLLAISMTGRIGAAPATTMTEHRRRALDKVSDAPAYLPANTTIGGPAAATCSGSLLYVEQANVLASNSAPNDFFGDSIAISGNTAVVGSAAGAAYVLIRNGTVWSEQQKLTTNAVAFGFGASVAIDGDTLVVGAISDTVGSNIGQGSAYVFVRSGAVWTQQQKLVASDGESFDGFGNSVGISGDTVVVGSVFDNVGNNDAQGSAYVFKRSGALWNQQQQLVASDGAPVDEFGWSVAIDGETIVVGAFVDSDAFQEQGSAYVFVRSGVSWSQQQKLLASDASNFDFFGQSVAISGDHIVVGANSAGAPSSGEAYVFVRSGTVWSQAQILKGNDSAFGDDFGRSVAIDADAIAVGASGADVGANQNQGAVYVFLQSGASWVQLQKLTASAEAAGQFFGQPVAISGDVLLSGFFNEVVPMPVRGSVRIFGRGCLDACMQDDSNSGTKLLFDSTTGSYAFFCNGLVLTGQAIVTRRGSTVTLTDNSPDRRLTATFTGGGINKGTATLQSPPGRTLCTLRDSNTSNNNCSSSG